MLDVARLDRVYQYTLAVARQLEDFQQRELGPIHLLKYAYLADVAYAAAGQGVYTGVDWRFFHFGPWSEAAFERIEPALLPVAAKKKSVASKFGDDFTRYTFDDPGHSERLARALEDALPLTIAGALCEAVKKHGSDTADLLRHVYLTPPMLHAAPGEALSFDTLAADSVQPSSMVELDRKTIKARRSAIEAARATVLKKLSARTRQQTIEPAPRYDDVFFEGTAHLDKLAGSPIETAVGVVKFEESVWTSAQRREPDIP